jgi:molybdopterin converting factor small subunit
MAQIDLTALEAEAVAEEKAARAAELNDNEKKAHELLERRAEAKSKRFEAERARREVDAGAREAAARAVAGDRYLVRAIDLVSFFPPGTAPTSDRLPTGGVIVVRSPTEEASKQMTRDQEAKKKSADTILLDVLLSSVVDPSPGDVEASAAARPFFEAYPGAAANAAGVVLELGGLRQEAAKRGRA